MSFKRGKPAQIAGGEVVERSANEFDSMELPTKKHKASDKLSDYAFILYGERGIGKSTLADAIFGGNALFAMFESDRTLEVYEVLCQRWGQFTATVDKFLEGDHEYTGIVCDNGAMSYDAAMEEACQIHGFDHPGGMNDYGASWNKVRKVFQAPFRKLLVCKYGLGIICHEKEKEISTKSGRAYIKMGPDWQGQADSFLGAFVENIWYYHYAGSERYLQIVGDEYITAKTKFERHFFTPKGERIVRIPMGNSVQEAVKNLTLAFENKQKETFADVGILTGKGGDKETGSGSSSFKKSR